MNVFCEPPPDLSKAMGRVTAAFKRENPPRDVHFVDRMQDADLVVLHVIGYPETVEIVSEIKRRGQQYAIIQYCMRSTQAPHTDHWAEIWWNAKLVWSYYDLRRLIEADGGRFNFNFMFAPMGVDPIFARTPLRTLKVWTMMSSGYVAESESVNEVAQAVKRINGRLFHLGPRDACPMADAWGIGIDDSTLADLYSRCCFVSGLRRAEGFEMPAAEGLVCGARPIVFDAVHYRCWYDGFAEFIPEGTPDEVTNEIGRVFEKGLRQVTAVEKAKACDRFNWSRITSQFWGEVN